jgi:hypothetical protein
MKPFLCLLLLFQLAVPLGHSADRVALVIGNNDYADVPLNNAVRDARAMTTMLISSLGFPEDGVVHVENADRLGIFDAFGRFLSIAGEAQVAIVYYAGHGMESLDGKENFLIPVDAPIRSSDPNVVTVAKSEAALRAAGVSLMALTSDLAASTNAAKIILMDCCRERPAGRGAARAGGGLAIYEDGQIPADTLMILAAAPSRAASDGESHGPFTAALIDVLPRGGVSLLDAFFAVSDQVQKDTSGQQVPWLRFDGSGQVFRERSFLGQAAPMEGRIEEGAKAAMASDPREGGGVQPMRSLDPGAAGNPALAQVPEDLRLIHGLSNEITWSGDHNQDENGQIVVGYAGPRDGNDLMIEIFKFNPPLDEANVDRRENWECVLSREVGYPYRVDVEGSSLTIMYGSQGLFDGYEFVKGKFLKSE